MENKLVLERSSNTHVLESKAEIVNVVEHGEGAMTVTTQGESYVTHGEHGTLAIESKRFSKINQKEYNPITRKIMNAID